MLSLRNMKRISIKNIFGIHLMVLFWLMQQPKVPQFALVYNLLFFVTLFWATENTHSDEPLQFALLINLMSIFFDAFILVSKREEIFYNYNYDYGMAVIGNIVIRLLTSICLYWIGQSRNGPIARMFSKSPTNVDQVEEADDEH